MRGTARSNVPRAPVSWSSGIGSRVGIAVTGRRGLRWIIVSRHRNQISTTTRQEADTFCFAEFRPIPGAGGFQISNPSAIDLTSLCASLSVFDETSIQDLREKSVKLTAYLQHLLFKDTAVHDVERPFRLITPLDPSHRGAQLCLLLKPGLLERVAAKLEEAGIVVDKRKPDVIRVAPVPLYNSFYDVWRFVQVFRDAVEL